MISFDSIIHVAQAAEEAAHATESSGGIAAMFGLSGKLFIAQLVNFGIVLLVLWKWVFTPVTKALEKRTKKIEDSLNTAKTIEEDKLQFDAWRKEEMAKTRQEAAAIITKAQIEAEAVKATIVEQTKTEQQRIQDQAKQEIEHQAKQSITAAKKELAGLVVEATEKIIKEKLDDKKDKKLIESALQSLT